LKINGIFVPHIEKILLTTTEQPATLFVFGDVHYGSPNFCKRKFNEFLTKCKNTPNAYFLGMGDYFDLLSSSERKTITGNLHESTEKTLDNLYRNLTEDLASKLDFMRGKILGLVEGNHHANLLTGITTTQYLCEMLDCKYLGASGFVRLSFDYHGKRTSKDILAHHGCGAARLPGGSINRVYQMRDIAEADIYLMGHEHKCNAATAATLYMDQFGNIKQREMYFARSGSFLKAYEQGSPSYVVDAAMAPSNLGWLEFTFTPRKEDNEFTVKIKATI